MTCPVQVVFDSTVVVYEATIPSQMHCIQKCQTEYMCLTLGMYKTVACGLGQRKPQA